MASKIFKTQYDKHDRKIMNPGIVDIPVRKAEKVKGKLVVNDTKETFDMAAYINSFKDSVDIDILLKRFANGEPDAIDKLTRRYGDFLDVTGIPDNWNDLHNHIQNGKNMFYELDPEIREKFNNNYEEFISEINTDAFYEKLGINKKAPAEVPAEDTRATTDSKE